MQHTEIIERVKKVVDDQLGIPAAHQKYSDRLVDDLVPDESDPVGERTVMHRFDDRMEPNNGNGTDPARYVRSEKEKERLLRLAVNRSDRLLALRGLVYDIARTPLHGESCPDASSGRQVWWTASTYWSGLPRSSSSAARR